MSLSYLLNLCQLALMTDMSLAKWCWFLFCRLRFVLLLDMPTICIGLVWSAAATTLPNSPGQCARPNTIKPRTVVRVLNMVLGDRFFVRPSSSLLVTYRNSRSGSFRKYVPNRCATLEITIAVLSRSSWRASRNSRYAGVSCRTGKGAIGLNSQVIAKMLPCGDRPQT